MPTSVTMELSAESKAELSRLLASSYELYNKVAYRALKKTVAGTKTDESNAARKGQLNLRKAYVDQHLRAVMGDYERLTFGVFAKSKPVGMINFIGTKQTQTGVSVKVTANGSRSILRHAFIANIKSEKDVELDQSGTANVFWRGAKDGSPPPYRVPVNKMPKNYKAYFAAMKNTENPRRNPILRRVGPRITDILAKPEIMKMITSAADARLQVDLDYELTRELKKL